MIPITIPSVGESVAEVEIGSWLKHEGDAVAKDENIVVIESDKSTVELAAPADGVLGKIHKQAGEKVSVGETIGTIEPGSGNGAARAKPKAETESKKKPSAARKEDASARAPESVNGQAKPAQIAASEAPPVEKNEARSSAQQPAEARVLNQPVAQNHKPEDETPRELRDDSKPARMRPIIVGSTPDADDETAQAESRAQSESPAPESRHEIAPVQSRSARGERSEKTVALTPLRRAVAKRLVQAQHEAALLTTFNEIDMSAVKSLRAAEGERFANRHGARLGFMSFFVKATIAALKLVPQLNAELRGDALIYHDYYDIGIAVGSGKGLVVPVLRDAHLLSFAEIEKAIADFAGRAEENRLKPADLDPGTFTISNGGIYGSLLSTPIVNPPQSGILGMHAILDRPVADDGAVVIRPMMYVALSYDHRVIDGREAVTFLRSVKDNIEKPARLLLDS